MTAVSPTPSGVGRVLDVYRRVLSVVVRVLGAVAGASLLVMVLVTTADVVLRGFRHSFTGAYDLVRIAGAITIAAALPYTTAIKGHVAIEYFFHKLGRRGRVAVDTLLRLVVMALFSLLTWGCLDYGHALRIRGEVSMTLQLPVFWVPYVLAFSCVLVVLITFYHLVRPGREMIQP
jgi:TRAP-type C4-dicarboxylate transport system permease small subunit